jgi:hypothetical protein
MGSQNEYFELPLLAIYGQSFADIPSHPLPIDKLLEVVNNFM